MKASSDFFNSASSNNTPTVPGCSVSGNQREELRAITAGGAHEYPHDLGLLTMADVAELLYCSKAHVSKAVSGRVFHPPLVCKSSVSRHSSSWSLRRPDRADSPTPRSTVTRFSALWSFRTLLFRRRVAVGKCLEKSHQHVFLLVGQFQIAKLFSIDRQRILGCRPTRDLLAGVTRSAPG